MYFSHNNLTYFNKLLKLWKKNKIDLQLYQLKGFNDFWSDQRAMKTHVESNWISLMKC